MLFLTRFFGVTGSDADRDLIREKAEIEEITKLSLQMQAKAAAKQHRPLARGTHAKGVCARAQFEVFDVTRGRAGTLADRLAQGIFATPGIYPAIARFGNADPNKNSDFKADVRSLSFSVDLDRVKANISGAHPGRQDFSMQNTKTLPINDSSAFLAIMKLLTASNPAVGLWGLPLKDKLRVLENPDSFAISIASGHQTLSTTALRKRRAVSPRPGGCCKVLGHALAGQSSGSTATKKPKRPAG